MARRADSDLPADFCQGHLAGPYLPVTQCERHLSERIRLIVQSPPCLQVPLPGTCAQELWPTALWFCANAVPVALSLCLQVPLLGPAAFMGWTPPPCCTALSCKHWADRATKVVPALPAGASAGASCAAELEEWNSAAMELGGLTGFAHVNLRAADFKQAEAAGVAIARLQAEPCRLQAVLLPFGDKDEAMPFTGVPHVPTFHTPC